VIVAELVMLCVDVTRFEDDGVDEDTPDPEAVVDPNTEPAVVGAS
jgi:hypothetical protein